MKAITQRDAQIRFLASIGEAVDKKSALIEVYVSGDREDADQTARMKRYRGQTTARVYTRKIGWADGLQVRVHVVVVRLSQGKTK